MTPVMTGLGTSWRMATPDVDLTELLTQLYVPIDPEATAPSVPTLYELRFTDGRRRALIDRDGEPFLEDQAFERVLGLLVWAVNRQVLEHAAKRLVLHAGVVASPDGGAVALPAASGAGKTTLTTALLLRGFAYLTDEAAAVGTDLIIEGLVKPLSIDRGSWPLFPQLRPQLPQNLIGLMDDQWQVPAHSLSSVSRRARLKAIIFPNHVPGAATSLRRLDPIESLDRARANAFGTLHRALPASRIAELAEVVTQVPSFDLISGDLEAACEAVQGVLQSGHQAHATARWHGG